MMASAQANLDLLAQQLHDAYSARETAGRAAYASRSEYRVAIAPLDAAIVAAEDAYAAACIESGAEPPEVWLSRTIKTAVAALMASGVSFEDATEQATTSGLLGQWRANMMSRL